MRFIPFAAALALCACSSSGSTTTDPTHAAGTTSVTTTASAAIAAAPATVSDSRATPSPGELKTFKDWTVGCDNLLSCTMSSLSPDEGEFQKMAVAIIRAAGPDGGFAITVTPVGDANGTAAALLVDGKRFALADDKLGASDAAALADALGTAKALVVVDASGVALANISLAGSSASLRYVDAVQGRAGTVTATVAKGGNAGSTVPPAPAVPTIVASDMTEDKADPALIEMLRHQGGCEDDEMAAQTAAEAYALGSGKMLVLVPCSAGAYNLSSALFVVENGKGVPAQVDAASGFRAEGDSPAPPELVNAMLDGGALTSYAKGRGLGDCGSTQRFVWDGIRLRLAEQRDMGECRGNPNFIVTWRAMVVRK